MTVSFHTHSQQMTFVDPTVAPPVTVSANNLVPGRTYDVYLVLQNDSTSEALGVQVHVNHSAFGIGRPPGDSGITQPAPVNVPPALIAGDPALVGLATIAFQFTAPPGGHGCLVATIEPVGPSISQNVTVVGIPVGVPSTLSFMVFGGATTEVMTLTLAERVQATGAPVAPAESWQPLLIAPPGTGGPAAPTPAPAPLTLTLAPNGFYSVGLRVTVAASATQAHVFHIAGVVGGQEVGEVDIVVNPLPRESYVAPAPYITGGYQSPDVILVDPATHVPVPLGGLPGGPWDTLLRPNTDYDFHAVVHNASLTAAVNTIVRFWSFDGGVGSAGVLIDVRSVTVPAGSQVEVQSAHPFRGAPLNHPHRCAVVSIANSLSAHCTADATTANDIPDPAADLIHSCSAWRNTDARVVFILKPWDIFLDVIYPLPTPDPGPVEVEVEALRVPVGWEQTPEVQRLEQTLHLLGKRTTYPLYLLPELRKTLEGADLAIEIAPRDPGVKIERGPAAQPGQAGQPIGGVGLATRAVTARIHPIAGKPAPLVLKGTTPKDARKGDIFLVYVTARYPQTKLSPARAIQATEILHVQG